MENIAKKPVGKIVAEYFSSYSVFESHKINYYNKGKRTLEGVAAEHAIDLPALTREIKKNRSSSRKDEEFNSWLLDSLCDKPLLKFSVFNLEGDLTSILEYFYSFFLTNQRAIP